MSRPRRLLAVGLVLLVVAGAVAFFVSRSTVAADPRAAAQTSFPDLAGATGEPTLESLGSLSPVPGAVAEASGPFDDRFHFRELAFDGAVLTGEADITSDVSTLLEFEALAGFYDADGALLGTARDVYHLDEDTASHAPEGPPSEVHRFRIDVPAGLRGRAVSAAVGVPVLVNE